VFNIFKMQQFVVSDKHGLSRDVALYAHAGESLVSGRGSGFMDSRVSPYGEGDRMS